MEQSIWQAIGDFFCSLDWKSIIGYGAFSGLSVGSVVYYVGKKYLGKVGEQAAELMFTKRKAEISEAVKNEFTTATEHLKAELSRQNTAFGVNYSFSYTERAKVLLELYRKMLDLVAGAETLTNLFVPGATVGLQAAEMENRVRNLNNAHIEFNSFYAQNRILLGKELSRRIYDFYAAIIGMCKQYHTEHSRLNLPLIKDDEQEKQKIYNKLNELSQQVHQRCNEIDEFADIFRDLIFPA